eukprot:TRINITY_DN56971_c0_g1_i1.p1 TRINITY_DN56971_c0_g1~~TRINITY_DN56971_c0_g1_i1.p1  ORF type:complete len:376 (-),score=51.74 TRINITY_DN56971_c0_g1_i1:49-1149(-)
MAQARDGSFEWIRKANSRDDREERRQIATATRKAIDNQCYSLGSGIIRLEHIAQMVDGTKLISPTVGEWPSASVSVNEPLPFPPEWNKATSMKFVRQTVLDAASDQVRAGRRVAVVNAASAYQTGGGFKGGGRHALEESMCAQSTLYKSLERLQVLAQSAGVQAPPWAVPPKQSGGRPWDMHIPDDGAALSPCVEVFRKGTYDGYTFDARTVIDAVSSVAFPNCNARVRDSPIDAEPAATQLECSDEPIDAHRDPSAPAHSDAPYIAQLERKWRAALAAVAYYTEADCLIVPDAGCGVFSNPPDLVGAAFGRVLRNEFSGRFSDVLIACRSGPAGEQFSASAEKAFGESKLVRSRSNILVEASFTC